MRIFIVSKYEVILGTVLQYRIFFFCISDCTFSTSLEKMSLPCQSRFPMRELLHRPRKGKAFPSLRLLVVGAPQRSRFKSM
jgi:hypothetical protein